MTAYFLGASPERYLGIAMAHRAAHAGRFVIESAGRYAVEANLRPSADALGLPMTSIAETPGEAVGSPRVALYAGAAVGYPYYAYYAHCLLSLGLVPMLVDAASIAAGALRSADLLVMPGGFATWGLDRAEDMAGVDDEVRQFVGRGGAYLGSCGGAFYVSEGRPNWLGLIDAKPTYTHEYLQTGAALVNVRLSNPTIRGSLPEHIEVPYYHGPAYPGSDRRARTLGTFSGFAMPSRLFIDNPLERATYERDLAEAPAILAADPGVARAIVFSPHPEMGDFVRKGIAIDGYIRRYLPVRGEKTMDETLRFYGGEDSLSYELVLNALRYLDVMTGTKPRARSAPLPAAGAGTLADHLAVVDLALTSALQAAEARVAREERPAFASLLGHELLRRGAEWQHVASEHSSAINARPPDPNLVECLIRSLSDAAASLPATRDAPIAQTIVMLELPTRLVAAANRLIRCDLALER